VEVRKGDALALPLEDQSIDVVISNGVLNLVPDKLAAFGEIARVLKPGGRLLLGDIVSSRSCRRKSEETLISGRVESGVLSRRESSSPSSLRSDSATSDWHSVSTALKAHPRTHRAQVRSARRQRIRAALRRRARTNAAVRSIRDDRALKGGPTMIFRPYYYFETGCAAYLFGCGTLGKCAVVDAHEEDVGAYQAFAASKGMQITHVIDTHVHADHRSGGALLARMAQAQYCLHESARVRLSFEPLRDGQRVELGNTCVEVMHTPGHTPESMCLW